MNYCRVERFPKRASADGVLAVGEKDESLLSLGVGAFGDEFGSEDDCIVERRQSVAYGRRKHFSSLVLAAIPGAKKRGLGIAERNQGDVFFGYACGLRKQIERVRDFFAKVRVHRFAGIDKDRDFQLGIVRTSKALEIPDDKTSVDDREITGLQGGHAVIVLVGG